MTNSVREGTCDSFMAVLDAAGGYPFTRAEIIDAIREGVQQAVAEYLAAHGLEPQDARHTEPA